MKKIFKILLIISFLPYIFILVGGVLSAIYGIPDLESIILTVFAKPWLGEQEINYLYGLEAFTYVAIFSFINMTVFIPIIPISILYQVGYLIIKLIKNKKILKNQ